MAIGRISGPLLKANLLRDGVNLAFETDLLFLDVINGRVGIKTTTPSHDLTINGTTRTTNLIVDTQADLASFTILGNTISSSNSVINLSPSGANPVVYQGKIVVDQLQISTNIIQTTGTNTDLDITTTGIGKVIVNANMLVNGDLHATGTITADGSITIGDSNTDNVVFNADVASNIRPDITNTYDLGSDPTIGGHAWKTAYIDDVQTTNITSTAITVNGINLVLPQGNIRYVSTNGNDTNSGVHENNPYLTIKHALSVAVAGEVIYIYPGTYSEIFPLTIPAGVTVRGAGLRAVTIQPTVGTIDKDAFLLNGETTIEDLTVAGYRYNGTNNTGYAFRFANNFLITNKSPYVRNVTVITKGSTTNAGDPYGFDSNDAGKGVFLDGSVANAASNEVCCLFHAVTFFTPNQETLVVTNGIRSEWLNSFTYFADKGIYAYSSANGFAGAGLTRLRIPTRTGTWAVGNTLTSYDTDGTTVLGTGTIASISGDYVNLTGRQLGFTTITDRVPKAIYANGNAHLSTAIKKFGTASAYLDGVNSFVNVAAHPDFNFGSGSFTIEMWVYRTIDPAVIQILMDMRTTTPSFAVVLSINSSHHAELTVNGVDVITTGVAIPTNTWTHIALSKAGTSSRIFVNGTQSGITYTDTNTYIMSPVRIGARFDGTLLFTGYIDSVRISKGIGRYTSTFVEPVVELTGDADTVLLLNFNGYDNSTTMLDSGITLQDLRTSAGGRSTIINFADYSDFGAEIRIIGSANVYGNYGVYADGIGVTIHLISHNFSFVTSGKDSSDTIPDPFVDKHDFEIVELNGAKVYYVSVNESGDFRVGNNFYVDQSTGDVQFNNQTLNITSAAGVTFTDGINTTTITAEDIVTGNIRISGNTIESLTGDINVTAASGAINLQNNTYITGDLDVTGDVHIGGNITIGDQTSDTVTFIAAINSNLTPATTEFYDLGTSSLRWKTAFLGRAEIDALVIDNNTISTTNGNDDLILIANGTGRIYIPSNDVKINQNLTVDQNLTVTTGTTYLKNVGITGTITQTGDIGQTGNFTSSGDTLITGNITGTGYVQLPKIRLENNIISTTATDTDLELRANGSGNVVFEGIKVSDNNIQSIVTNSNIILTPQGTGSVVIDSNQSLVIPVGTTLERPATPTNGMIRYNTTTARYEARSGSYWIKLGGLEDLSGNTRILAESSPGANDNILYFYANNNLTTTIDSTKLYSQRIKTDNLDINNNTISAIDADSNINFTTSGTGSVKIGNLSIKNNTITNVSSGAVTEFLESSTGYVRIAGTNGVVIPVGTNLERPGYAVPGMTRFNTDLQIIEVFNGTIWAGVSGTAGGITTAEAYDIGFAIALILG